MYFNFRYCLLLTALVSTVFGSGPSTPLLAKTTVNKGLVDGIGPILSALVYDLQCNPLKTIAALASEIVDLIENLLGDVPLSPKYLAEQIINLINSLVDVTSLGEIIDLVNNLTTLIGTENLGRVNSLLKALLPIIKNLSCDKLAPIEPLIVSLVQSPEDNVTPATDIVSDSIDTLNLPASNNLTDIIPTTVTQLSSFINKLLCKPLKALTFIANDILKISSNVICETLTTVRGVTSGLIGLITNLSLNPVDSLSFITFEVTKFLQKGRCVTLLPLDCFVQSLLQFIGDLSCEKLSVLNKLLEEASSQKGLSMSIDYLTEDILNLKRNVGKQLLALKYDLLCEPTYCMLQYIDDFILLVDNLYCESCQNIEDIISEFIQLIINLSKEPMDCIEDLTRRLLFLLKTFKCTTMDPVELLVEKLLILIGKLSCKKLALINDLLEASNRIRKINLT